MLCGPVILSASDGRAEELSEEPHQTEGETNIEAISAIDPAMHRVPPVAIRKPYLTIT